MAPSNPLKFLLYCVWLGLGIVCREKSAGQNAVAAPLRRQAFGPLGVVVRPRFKICLAFVWISRDCSVSAAMAGTIGRIVRLSHLFIGRTIWPLLRPLPVQRFLQQTAWSSKKNELEGGIPFFVWGRCGNLESAPQFGKSLHNSWHTLCSPWARVSCTQPASLWCVNPVLCGVWMGGWVCVGISDVCFAMDWQVKA